MIIRELRLRDFDIQTDIVRLELRQNFVNETPGPSDENTFELNPILEKYPKLESLYVCAHLYTKNLHHPTLRSLTLEGSLFGKS